MQFSVLDWTKLKSYPFYVYKYCAPRAPCCKMKNDRMTNLKAAESVIYSFNQHMLHGALYKIAKWTCNKE